MSKKIKTLIIIVISLILFGAFFFTSYIKPEGLSQQLNPNSLGNTSEVNKVMLEINDIKYESEIIGVISVYDFMSKLQSEGKITFKDKTYAGMGKLIEEINGIRGENNKYWIYSVNGIEAQVGVSDYKIKGGDVVSWEMKSASF